MTTDAERGSATIFVVAAAGLLMFIGLGLGGVAAIVLTQRSAQAAADLAALAGASAAMAGADGCTAARGIAEANSASLDGCTANGTANGTVITVEVTVAGPRLVGRRYDVTAEARAGPADAAG